jgi:hypothetical protein
LERHRKFCNNSRLPASDGQEKWFSPSPSHNDTAAPLDFDHGAAIGLSKFLSQRLPDVEALTAGGAGVPMLAASYATEKRLTCTALVPEWGRFPDAQAVARRDAELVAMADAAVFVLTDRDPHARRLLEMLRAKGVAVPIIGEGTPAKVKRVSRMEAREAVRGRSRLLDQKSDRREVLELDCSAHLREPASTGGRGRRKWFRGVAVLLSFPRRFKGDSCTPKVRPKPRTPADVGGK